MVFAHDPEQKRALIIEDDVLIAMDLEEMLLQMGFSGVDTARSSEEADHIESEDFSIVIADLHLGETSSESQLKRYAEAGTPIIIATGSAEAVTVAAAYPRCAPLEKPYTRLELEAALRAVGAL
jgi:DNA-binding response OmpR family regulator